MSPVADVVIRRALARCDAEQEEIRRRPDVLDGTAPALLVTMGMFDWAMERLAILREADPARWPHVWRWKRVLAGYHGWPCRVAVRGRLNSALVVFPDGHMVVTSRNGLRKRDTHTEEADHKGRQGVPARGAAGKPDLVPGMWAPGQPGAGWAKRSVAALAAG